MGQVLYHGAESHKREKKQEQSLPKKKYIFDFLKVWANESEGRARDKKGLQQRGIHTSKST
jgi:hypothetical protein